MKYSPEEIGKLIRKEREARKWSQATLGAKLHVSGKQISNYEHGDPIPPIEALFSLCEIFNCELGYLIGEPRYSNRTAILTEINNLTGLSNDAIDSISSITGTSRYCPSFGIKSEKYRRLLNSLLTSEHFRYFMECLSDLDDAVQKRNNIFTDLSKKYGYTLFSEALEIYTSHISYEDDVSTKLRPELLDAIKEIDSAIDQQNTLSYPIKVSRYELNEAFESLITSLYPKKED